MGDWSMLEGQKVDTVGQNLAASRGTTVTGGAANTKGNWAQIVAATTYVTDAVLISITTQRSYDFLVDIGIGAAGSEQIIISDLLFGPCGYGYYPSVYFFPVAIPANTRIASRCQATGAGTPEVYVVISLLSQGFLPSSPLGRVTTYGAATADSGGVSVDPGGTLNTKNAYSQINGATTAPIRVLVVGFGHQNNNARTTCDWLVDIAIGAAASEQIIIPNLQLGSHATPDNVSPGVIGPFFIDIPAGVRLAARAQCSIVDATDRLFDIVLYGID